jgi:rhodanese-related sulfurtransferase
MEIRTISPMGLREVFAAGGDVELIDVRTPMEYRELHAESAKNIPLDQLDPAVFIHAGDGSPRKPLYVICRSGARGRQACEKLINAGCTDVINVDGGTLAWDSAGLPVVKGKKSMSLERQVRIAAGFLILLGSALSWFVHPGFIAIPAFVGAGLMHAGITDTCGMGLLLAKMPWNRGNESKCGCD